MGFYDNLDFLNFHADSTSDVQLHVAFFLVIRDNDSIQRL